MRVVVETLAENMEKYQRTDHRFTVVHFGVSTEEQVKELKKLGAIVSANPYYVTALAKKYSEEGVGPVRSLNMVRLGSVAKEGITIGLHSDMPMAPADPLFLAWCAANRIIDESTDQPTVAAPHQCISVEHALRAITIDAAYFMQLENEIGSIKPNKKANFTILDQDPLAVPKEKLKDIAVWGCVFEGTKFPAHQTDTSELEPVTTEVSKFDMKNVNLAEVAVTRG